jgi:hypothetical protein
MREAKFKIGDMVDTNWIGIGKVTDVMYSSHKDSYTYEVTNDQTAAELFSEDELQMVPEKKDYSMTIQIDIANNVLIASLFEKVGDDLVTLAKGHGHLIHEGELGIAQAASFACKRLYESLGGTLTKGGSWR